LTDKIWEAPLFSTPGLDIACIMDAFSKPCASMLIPLLCLLLMPPFSGSARGWDNITFSLENDQFANRNSDKYYTHGAKLTWISSCLPDRDNSFRPPWRRPFFDRILPAEGNAPRFGSFALAQIIYTPLELNQNDPDGTDRPYAGFSYFSAGIHRVSFHKLDSLEITVGLVGRHSYAEDIQKTFHKWINSAEPMGWQNQLHDEPVLNVSFDRKWKIFQKEFSGLGIDLIPRAGVSIGNALTEAGAGAQIRFGWHLPDDFGTYPIMFGSESNVPGNQPPAAESRGRFGANLFLGANGHAVLRNIFLDGNTFRDSHSVDKRHFVADYIGGIVVIVKKVKISYSYVSRSKEFKTQIKNQHFGSVSVAFSW